MNDKIKISVMSSPALTKIADTKGDFAYPKKFNGKVPLKVKMNYTVKPDFPFIGASPNVVCNAGKEYYVWVNSYGAVTAVLENGERLGLKPDEFEVTEFHEPKPQIQNSRAGKQKTTS